MEIGVGNKTELRGTEVEAPQIAFIKTDPNKAGELILSGSTDTTQISQTEKTETAGVWQEQKGQGSTTQTLKQTQLKGNVNFDNALKITVQIPDTKGGQDLKTQIQALAGQSASTGNNTGLEYLNTLAQRTDIQWDKVALAHEKWSYNQAGLTPAGAALLTIAVAAYTGGMGTQMLGGANSAALGLTTTTTTGAITTTALGSAFNAGFASLASQTAVAMVNNQGDIGKTLEQLGKQESIKNLLTVMVTAGALSNLNQTLGFNGQSGAGASGTNGITTSQAANQFSSNLLRNVTNNVAGAAIDSAINGKPLDEKTLSAALSSALITAGMAQGANAIGASDLDHFTNKLAHAVLGCAGGAAMGGSCESGAVGAVVGELAAEYINPTADPALREQTLAFAKTMAAVAGVVVGGGGNNAADVNVAATAGANAAEDNYLTYAQEQKRDKELTACKTLTCSASVSRKYAGISALQDAGLMVGVGGGIGYQTVEQAAAVVELIKNLPETLTALKAIVIDPEFRAKVGGQLANEYSQRIDMQTRAYNDGGWDGSLTAGVEAGRLAVDIVAVGTGVLGAGKLATRIASTGGTVIADAATTLALKSATVFDSLDAAGQARWLSKTSSWRNSTSELAQMELDTGAKSHPLLRHGDQVELAQLQQRALTGVTPDGVAGPIVNSTRWLNNEDMLAAVKQAQARYAAGDFGAGTAARPSYEISMGKTIGDGYYKNSTKYGNSTTATVALDAKGLPVKLP